MNTQKWITHFETNTKVNDTLALPSELCELPTGTRSVLAASLATFQLGESGTGSRLRRYAREVAPLENYRGYQRAIDRFIAEEQSHSRLLAKAVEHLGGKLLSKQWTNSIFRKFRFLGNLEFAIQILLTAELIAEVYFGLLYLHCPDPLIRTVAKKLLSDETKHLRFQREFFAERIMTFNPLGRYLWTAQFRLIHSVTAMVVSFDHRRTLNTLNITPKDFQRRCLKSAERFLDKLEKCINTSKRSQNEEAPVASRELT